MRKTIMCIIVLSACACMASAVFAAEEELDTFRPGRDRTVLGTITAIDRETGDIIVKDEIKLIDRPIHLRAEDRSKVKVGDRVKIMLQPNTNVARSIIMENENVKQE